MVLVTIGILAVTSYTAKVFLHQADIMEGQLEEMRGAGQQTERLIILNTGQMLNAAKTAGAAGDQAKATIRVADEAKKANETTREALVNGERAYISAVPNVEPPTVVEIENEPAIILRFEWQNAGSTPTRGLLTHVSAKISDNVLPDNFDFPDLWFGREPIPTPGVIGPKGAIQFNTRTPVQATDIRGILEKRRHFYIFGAGPDTTTFSRGHQPISLDLHLNWSWLKCNPLLMLRQLPQTLM